MRKNSNKGKVKKENITANSCKKHKSYEYI